MIIHSKSCQLYQGTYYCITEGGKELLGEGAEGELEESSATPGVINSIRA